MATRIAATGLFALLALAATAMFPANEAHAQVTPTPALTGLELSVVDLRLAQSNFAAAAATARRQEISPDFAADTTAYTSTLIENDVAAFGSNAALALSLTITSGVVLCRGSTLVGSGTVSGGGDVGLDLGFGDELPSTPRAGTPTRSSYNIYILANTIDVGTITCAEAASTGGVVTRTFVVSRSADSAPSVRITQSGAATLANDGGSDTFSVDITDYDFAAVETSNTLAANSLRVLDVRMTLSGGNAGDVPTDLSPGGSTCLIDATTNISGCSRSFETMDYTISLPDDVGGAFFANNDADSFKLIVPRTLFSGNDASVPITVTAGTAATAVIPDAGSRHGTASVFGLDRTSTFAATGFSGGGVQGGLSSDAPTLGAGTASFTILALDGTATFTSQIRPAAALASGSISESDSDALSENGIEAVVQDFDNPPGGWDSFDCFFVLGGTATYGTDYIFRVGDSDIELNDVFPGGGTSGVIAEENCDPEGGETMSTDRIKILPDTTPERDETIILQLAGVTAFNDASPPASIGNAAIFSPATLILTIIDDDAPKEVTSFAADDDRIPEDGTESSTVTLTLDESVSPGSALLFPYTITGIQAGDITGNLRGNIMVPAGSNTGTLDITAVQDTEDEGASETMTITLGTLPTNAAGVQLTLASGVAAQDIAIDDDDGTDPVVRIRQTGRTARLTEARDADPGNSVTAIAGGSSTFDVVVEGYVFGGTQGDGTPGAHRNFLAMRMSIDDTANPGQNIPTNINSVPIAASTPTCVSNATSSGCVRSFNTTDFTISLPEVSGNPNPAFFTAGGNGERNEFFLVAPKSLFAGGGNGTIGITVTARDVAEARLGTAREFSVLTAQARGDISNQGEAVFSSGTTAVARNNITGSASFSIFSRPPTVALSTETAHDDTVLRLTYGAIPDAGTTLTTRLDLPDGTTATRVSDTEVSTPNYTLHLSDDDGSTITGLAFTTVNGNELTISVNRVALDGTVDTNSDGSGIIDVAVRSANVETENNFAITHASTRVDSGLFATDITGGTPVGTQTFSVVGNALDVATFTATGGGDTPITLETGVNLYPNVVVPIGIDTGGITFEPADDGPTGARMLLCDNDGNPLATSTGGLDLTDIDAFTAIPDITMGTTETIRLIIANNKAPSDCNIDPDIIHSDADAAGNRVYTFNVVSALDPTSVIVTSNATSVVEGGSAFNITVMLDAAVRETKQGGGNSTVRLPYVFSGAGTPGDFTYTVDGAAPTGLSGTLVFDYDATDPDGNQSKTIVVTTIADGTLEEGGETLNFKLTANDGTGQDHNGVVVEDGDEVDISINDSGPPTKVRITSPSTTPPNFDATSTLEDSISENGGSVTLTVELNNPVRPADFAEGATVEITIPYVVVLGTNTVTPGEVTCDGVACAAGEFVFGSGERTKTIVIAAIDDFAEEDDSNETIKIDLGSSEAAESVSFGTGGNIAVNTDDDATITIDDDDTPPTAVESVTASPDTIREKDSEVSTITVRLNSRAVFGNPITLNYAFDDNTATTELREATFGEDYTAECPGVAMCPVSGTGTFVFAAGEDTVTFVVTAVPSPEDGSEAGANGEDEGDEDFIFTVSLGGSSGSVTTLTDATATITITETATEAVVVKNEIETVTTLIGAAQVGSISGLIRTRITSPVSVSPPVTRAPSSPDTSSALHLPDNPQDMGDMLNGLGLEHSANADGGGVYAVWARGTYTSMKGDPTVDGMKVDYDGDSTGLGIGAEKVTSKYVAGVAVNWLTTDLDLKSEENEGLSKYEESLVMIAPYLALRRGNGRSFWISAGYGFGEADGTTAEDSLTASADVNVSFLNAGADFVITMNEYGELVGSLSALGVRKTVDAFAFEGVGPISQTSLTTFRGQGEVTYYRNIGAAGGRVRPYIGLATLHDAGDKLNDDSHALDLRGGGEFRGEKINASLEVSTELLREDHKSWSVSGSARYLFSPDELGMSLTLDGAHAIDSNMGLEGGYGMMVREVHKDALLTPFAGMRHGSGGNGEFSSGMRLAIGSDMDADLRAARAFGNDEDTLKLNFRRTF